MAAYHHVRDYRDTPGFLLEDAVFVRGQRVAQPVKRLDNAHGRAARPIETIRRDPLKLDVQVCELDGL